MRGLISKTLVAIALSLSVGNFAETAFGQSKEVFIDVTVQNGKGNLVTGIDPTHFSLFEDGKSQKITSINNDRSPISAGLIFDLSASMQRGFLPKIDPITWGRKAGFRFLELSRDDSEYFLLTFNSKVVLDSDFAGRSKILKLLNDTGFFPPPSGETALYDSMRSAIDKLGQAKNQKRVVFLFTDAVGDNASNRGYGDLERMARQKKVQIYVLAADNVSTPSENMAGTLSTLTPRTNFDDLADVTGGRSLLTANLDEAIRFAADVATSLQIQYRIGFVPNLTEKPDKWRKLEVKLNLSKTEKKNIGTPVVLCRKGYFPNLELTRQTNESTMKK